MIRLRTIVITGTLLLATLLGTLLRPTIAQGNKAPLLATVVPKQIGEWRELPNPMVQVDISVPTTSTNRDRPYDDMVSRTYVNKQGQQIMVALAYGSQQRQEVKIHRPELCYPAQGWRVESLRPVDFQVPVATSAHIPGFRWWSNKAKATTKPSATGSASATATATAAGKPAGPSSKKACKAA
jgi:hypothetical protein